jgi:thioesterase domain-containing protein
MVCVPSFPGRPQEYARFAAGFRGVRDMAVVPAPGFAAGEPLPATAAALVAVLAQSVRDWARGAPFVLAGHSSGGWVAHAVATRLLREGPAPSGIVLLDTFGTEQADATEDLVSGLPAVMLAGGQAADAGEDAWLTAMAHYFALDWASLEPTSLPTLLIRAGQPIARQGAAGGDWQPSWALASRLTVVDVPGDHFTMMADHARTTAGAVNDWLTALPMHRAAGNAGHPAVDARPRRDR